MKNYKCPFRVGDIVVCDGIHGIIHYMEQYKTVAYLWIWYGDHDNLKDIYWNGNSYKVRVDNQRTIEKKPMFSHSSFSELYMDAEDYHPMVGDLVISSSGIHKVVHTDLGVNIVDDTFYIRGHVKLDNGDMVRLFDVSYLAGGDLEE